MDAGDAPPARLPAGRRETRMTTSAKFERNQHLIADNGNE